MNIHRTSKSGLFLLELMIAILFFAIASAVCVQLFVTAHLTSQASRELNQAMLTVQSAAECVKEAEGSQERLLALLALEPQGDGTLSAYYDRDWAPAPPEGAAYVLCIRQETGAPLLSAQVSMLRREDESTIFELRVKRCLGPEEKGGAVS